MDPYSLIAQYPNAGEGFANAFNQGMRQNALSAFAQNPNAQTAGAAARYAPDAVLQYNLQAQKEKAALTAQQQQAWHEYAGNLAKWADTPEKWDQAVDYLAAQGHPEVLQLKGKFTPQLRANFMALGGVSEDKPQIVTTPPGGGAFQMTDSGLKPLVLPNDGTQPTGAPAPSPQAAGGDLRAAAIDAIQRGADPQQVLQRMIQLQGGGASNGTGGFPGPH